MVPPCVIFEDKHLLVVNKPAGWNTHAPSPFTGEGIYDWLRHREPRWASLAVIHRLDKETSGVMVFAKTPLANRSLTEQFTKRTVRKKYLLLTDKQVAQRELVPKSKIVRAGERYVSGVRGEFAETRFKIYSEGGVPRRPIPLLQKNLGLVELVPPKILVEAEPLTGRTHQIRVHAAELGFPVLGDTLYGGTPAHRVCLHALELTLRHPETGEEKTFNAPEDFSADTRLALRNAIIEPELTDAFRLIHGASDGWPGLHVDKLGDFLLAQSGAQSTASARWVDQIYAEAVPGALVRGAYHKILRREVRGKSLNEAAPHHVFGATAPEKFSIRENGLQFELSFSEGYSVGLFLDQRDNRRRILNGHVAAGFALRESPIADCPSPIEVLNTFAYTCGFSVCAAKAGMKTTSLDLSKKYLDWGRRNFELNGLNPAGHDFIFGDVFDWLKRLQKKQRAFDVILLDPPTFSRSKEFGAFQVEKDFGKLVKAALPLLKTHGVLFASSNAATWPAEKFLAGVRNAIASAKRKIVQEKYFPQPPDFPISRAEPGYLKTVWMRVA